MNYLDLYVPLTFLILSLISEKQKAYKLPLTAPDYRLNKWPMMKCLEQSTLTSERHGFDRSHIFEFAERLCNEA